MERSVNSVTLMRIPVQVEQAVLNMLVDTGALASLMNANDFKRNFPRVQLLQSHLAIQYYSEQAATCATSMQPCGTKAT